MWGRGRVAFVSFEACFALFLALFLSIHTSLCATGGICCDWVLSRGAARSLRFGMTHRSAEKKNDSATDSMIDS